MQLRSAESGVKPLGNTEILDHDVLSYADFWFAFEPIRLWGNSPKPPVHQAGQCSWEVDGSVGGLVWSSSF